MKNQTVVTIGRQFGSGGREIGKKLAEKLGIAYYDKELIDETAKKEGLSKTLVETYDEKPTGRFTFAMDSFGFNYMKTGMEVPIGVQVASVQFNVIKELAQRGPCVIIGRCADYVLGKEENALHVFVHAPLEVRIERICKRYNLAGDNAKKAILSIDKSRAAYYNYYTDQKWGDMRNYHLTVDSGDVGIAGAVEVIAKYLELRS